ncbi:DUF5815 family protein [Haloarchaeobius sp. HRN-SO-5]|uniref:DUF5815 family protein n=1 Tax=Haloarchaeobius sp. HRN-SO-5 TaxID=3446118 RepID=UPI003EBDCC2F
MSEPRVPGESGTTLSLPDGPTVDVRELNLGMREYTVDGERYAVVMDVHPPSRFFPESLVAVLRETVDTADEFEEFGTPHLMGIVMEEFPDEVVSADVSDDGTLGCSMIWLTAFDARRLHEILVELVVELMEHAISHSDDDDAMSEFEEQMLQFDVSEFVDAYRAQRDFESEHDRAL